MWFSRQVAWCKFCMWAALKLSLLHLHCNKRIRFLGNCLDVHLLLQSLFCMLTSVTLLTKVRINCRNNKKLLGRKRAFDRHCNMVLEKIREMCTEVCDTLFQPLRRLRVLLSIVVVTNIRYSGYRFQRLARAKKMPRLMNKDKFISKMFLQVTRSTLFSGKWNALCSRIFG